MRPSRSLAFLVTVLVVCGCARLRPLDTGPLPNPGFDHGHQDTPTDWTLSGGSGAWVREHGRRFVRVTGTGEPDESNYWRSADLSLEPGAVYSVRFRMRDLGGSGGCAITGPVFCNRDLPRADDQWQDVTSVFAVPHGLAPDRAWLRFGQWQAQGTIDFDQVRLSTVEPLYRRRNGVELGYGESIDGLKYTFRAPLALSSASRNHSRPLHRFTSSFNTNRWVFGADDSVVYRHRIAGYKHQEAQVGVSVNWHESGALVMDASPDGTNWTRLGRCDSTAILARPIPSELLPADEIWIRLSAESGRDLGADSDPGSFQVHAYEYHATLAGTPMSLTGRTEFVHLDPTTDISQVALLGLGDLRPGGRNQARLQVHAGAPEGRARTTVRVQDEAGHERVFRGERVTLTGEDTVLGCPYEIEGAGRFTLRVEVDGAVRFHGETEVRVPLLYETGFGNLLPGDSPALRVWSAPAGRHVARQRPAPERRGPALRLSAAGNEAEAVQLVLTPERRIRNLRLEATALTGADGHTLPAAVIDILRVHYVDVTEATDETGEPGLWPDPLPPVTEPLTLEPNANQPFWIRVNVPAETPPGTYAGQVRIQANGHSLEVPLELTVYGFSLPNRATCETAFGFDPSLVWQYHGLETEADRRRVLDAYWANFSAHRISPYDPAPLDPYTIDWPAVGAWEGDGVVDPENPAVGQGCLRLDDPYENRTVHHRYSKGVPIPARGFEVRFQYRCPNPGDVCQFTLGHLDATGAWMPYRNLDIRIPGGPEWQRFRHVVETFPENATAVTLGLWPTPWSESGEKTGTVWIDDLQLIDRDTGLDALNGRGAFEPVALSDLEPEIDWSAWDRAMERGVEHYGFNTFRLVLPGMGGGTFHARVEPTLLGYPEGTPEYDKAFAAVSTAVEGHLADRGWLDETFLYWFDEPEEKDYAFVMNGFRKVKEHAPGIRRMLTEQVETELIGGPDLWCPISFEYDHNAAEERRAAGERFWWYVCTGPKAPYCTLFLDHAAVELRVWLWQTWKRGITGVLVWQSNYWSSPTAYPDSLQNPYTDPMSWVTGYGVEPGARLPWGNGDGRFIYPPLAAADGHPAEPVISGPVDSVRWEMLRDGVEDYEYFVILERLLRENRERLPDTQYRAWAELLTVPEAVTRTLTDFSTTPEPVLEHRERLARAIEQVLDTVASEGN